MAGLRLRATGYQLLTIKRWRLTSFRCRSSEGGVERPIGGAGVTSSPNTGKPSTAASDQGLLDVVVELDDRHDAVVLRLSGEIDYYTAPILREALTAVLSVHSDRRLLALDLEHVVFIGSQGLVELVTASERMRQAGMMMRLAAANHTVRMLLAVTGTGELLALCPTVADAVAEFPPHR